MTEIFQNGALLFGAFFALLLLSCGTLLVGIGLFALQRRGAAGDWPQVPATIEVSEVRAERHFEDALLFRPLVRYRYAAPGGSFTGEKLATTGRLYPKPAAAQKIVARYPVGTTVMARYNPADPAEAVIEKEGFGGLWFVLFGLLCWLVPVVGGRAAGFSWPVVTAILGAPSLAIALLLARRRSPVAARRASGLYPAAGQGSDADVRRLLAQGEKLLAIRLYRELHGGGLKDAREAVEALASEGRPR